MIRAAPAALDLVQLVLPLDLDEPAGRHQIGENSGALSGHLDLQHTNAFERAGNDRAFVYCIQKSKTFYDSKCKRSHRNAFFFVFYYQRRGNPMAKTITDLSGNKKAAATSCEGVGQPFSWRYWLDRKVIGDARQWCDMLRVERRL